MTDQQITRCPITLDDWPRKNHFLFYKDFADPHFNLCFEIEITQLYQYAKKHQLSNFLVLLYIANQAANNTEAFLRRIDEDGQPYIISRTIPSATVMNDDNLFNFCNFDGDSNNLANFIESATKQMAKATTEEPLKHVVNKDYHSFYSIIPWLAFTGYKHAHSGQQAFNDIPKIVFGKYKFVGEQVFVPVSIELHHALADAIDMHLYQQQFMKYQQLLTV